MSGIAGEIEFDCAETADQHVFQDLLDEGAERIFGIGLLEVDGEGGDALGGAGQHADAIVGEVGARRRFIERTATAGLNAPGHTGDAVFDGVDGLAGDGHFGEAAQVGGRGFRHDPGTRERGCPRGEYGG
jgi:hypothetical protein